MIPTMKATGTELDIQTLLSLDITFFVLKLEKNHSAALGYVMKEQLFAFFSVLCQEDTGKPLQCTVRSIRGDIGV